MPLYYWSPENLRSEIDFLIQYEGKIIPVEVKAEENLQAKSLRLYSEKYHPFLGIKLSMRPMHLFVFVCDIAVANVSVLNRKLKKATRAVFCAPPGGSARNRSSDNETGTPQYQNVFPEMMVTL